MQQKALPLFIKGWENERKQNLNDYLCTVMEEQSILFSIDIANDIEKALSSAQYDRLFVLADETTARLCLPICNTCDRIKNAKLITIGAGDENKTLSSLSHVWQHLSEQHATRRSLLVNIGGGMVTDLGGFAASTFKRGIKFLNIPTTLLSMVDASVGGKTGINFNGLKNEIGSFRNAFEVIIATRFLRTLDHSNICSGFAEMLKHALISAKEDWAELMRFNLQMPDLPLLQNLVEKSVNVKKRIVREDPEEHGIRKALNFGHTAGHAIESMSLQSDRPVLHGYAVAWGIVCELYLSCKRLGFPHDIMLQTTCFIKENYGVFAFDCKQYEKLYEFMTHDKKNTSDAVNFTLLSDIGQPCINQPATKDEIYDMLDFYRETMGC